MLQVFQVKNSDGISPLMYQWYSGNNNGIVFRNADEYLKVINAFHSGEGSYENMRPQITIDFEY